MSTPEHDTGETGPLDAVTQAMESLATQVEGFDAADGLTKRIQGYVHDALGNGTIRDALTGRWLGHAIHPVLTDLPIGFWTSAFTLDLIGGRRSRVAAQRLVGIGVLCALPTAASGAADWSDTTGPARRVGAVHAALNTAAIACFTVSWLERRRAGATDEVCSSGSPEARWRPVVASLVATWSSGSASGWITRASTSSRANWTATDAVAEWNDDELRRVDAAGTGVAVVREGASWFGLAARCSHAGGPLDEGPVADGCIECPWHGSRFRLRDGTVARGPAFAPQPVVAVRVRDGVVEVKDDAAD